MRKGTQQITNQTRAGREVIDLVDVEIMRRKTELSGIKAGTLPWQSLETYKPGAMALFWMDDGLAEYPVYGVIEKRGMEDEPYIWDDNDYGYKACYAVFWTPFEKPARLNS